MARCVLGGTSFFAFALVGCSSPAGYRIGTTGGCNQAQVQPTDIPLGVGFSPGRSRGGNWLFPRQNPQVELLALLIASPGSTQGPVQRGVSTTGSTCCCVRAAAPTFGSWFASEDVLRTFKTAFPVDIAFAISYAKVSTGFCFLHAKHPETAIAVGIVRSTSLPPQHAHKPRSGRSEGLWVLLTVCFEGTAYPQNCCNSSKFNYLMQVESALRCCVPHHYIASLQKGRGENVTKEEVMRAWWGARKLALRSPHIPACKPSLFRSSQWRLLWLWLASQQSWLCDFCFQTVIFGNGSDFPFPNAVSLLSPAKPEAPPAPVQEKPSLSEEEIERKCKSIVDEFLHINDFKVSNVRSLLSRKVSCFGASGCFSVEPVVPSSPRGHRSSGTLWGLGGSSSMGVCCHTRSREGGLVCVL